MANGRTIQTLNPQRSQVLADFLSRQPKPTGVTPLAGVADLGTNLVNAFFKGQQLRGEQAQETAQQSELAGLLGDKTVEGALPQGGIGPGAPVQQPATIESLIQGLVSSKSPELNQLGVQQRLAQLGREQELQQTIGTEQRAEEAQIRKEGRAAKRGAGDGFTLGVGQKRFDAQGNEIASGAAQDVAKPPTGFRAVTTPEGQALEPIPGGPAAISAEEKIQEQKLVSEQRTKARAGQMQTATNSIKAATRALDFLNEKKKGLDPTGLAAQLTSFIGGSDANQLNKLIEPIRANLGFDALQKMREASPTGGALGSIAIRELDLLQSTLVNLDVTQKTEFVEQALKDVQTHFNNWLSAVNQAEEEGDVGGLSEEELRAIIGGQ